MSDLFGAFKKERYASLSEEEKAKLCPEERRLWQKWDSLKHVCVWVGVHYYMGAYKCLFVCVCRCEMHKCALGSHHFVGGSFINISANERDNRTEINPEKAGLVHGKIEHQVQRRLSGHSVLRRWFQFFEGDQAIHNPAYLTEWKDKDGNNTGVRMAKQRWS